MNAFFRSDLFLVPLFAILGVIGYGWVFFPKLGTLVTVLSSAFGLLVIIAGLLLRSCRTLRRTVGLGLHTDKVI